MISLFKTIVNYDKENGWSSIFDFFVKSIPEASQKTKEFFDLLALDPDVKLWNNEELINFAKSCDVSETSVIDFLSNVKTGEATLSNYQSYLQSTAKQTTTFATITQKAGSALKTIGGTLLSTFANMAAMYAASVAIEAIGTAIYNTIHATEIAIEKGKEAQEAIQNAKDNYSNKKEVLDNSGERYIELSGKIDSDTHENISATNEEYSEYLSLCNEIASVYPELVTSYDSQGVAILNLGSNASETSAKFQELIEKEKEAASVIASENFKAVAESAWIQYEDNKTKSAQYQTQANYNKSIINSSSSLPDKIKKAVDNLYPIINPDGTVKVNSSGNPVYPKDYSAFSEVTLTDEEYNLGTINDIKTALIQQGFTIEEGNKQIVNEAGQLEEVHSLIIGSGIDLEQRTGLYDKLTLLAAGYAQDVDMAEENLRQNIADQQSANEEAAEKINSVKTNAIDALGSKQIYSNLPEALQTKINNMVSAMDLNKMIEDGTLTKEQYENLPQYIIDNVVRPISRAYEDKEGQNIIDAISGLDEKLKSGELDQSDYRLQTKKQLDKLKDFYIEKFGEETGNSLYESFLENSDFTKLNDMNNELIANLDKATADDITKIHNLTKEEIEDVYSRWKDPSQSGSVIDIVNEVIAEHEQAQHIIDTSTPLTFSSLFKDPEGNNTDFSESLDDFQSNISTIQSALDSLSNGEDIDLIDLKQEFPQITESAKDLGDTLTDLKNQQLGDLFKEIYDSTKKLSDTSAVTDFISDIISAYNVSESDLTVIRSNILSSLLPNASNTLERQEIIQSINNLFNGITINAKSNLDVEIENFNSFLEIQDKLNAAMASSVTATGLTTEEIENVTNAYKNLEGYDPEKLFERTANGVHLNTAEVRKLDEQLRQNTMSDFLQAVADKQIELNQARAQGLDTTQLENELSVLQQLASQYDGLTSAYQRWLDAKSGGEEGDMYRSVTDTMIERGKELYDAQLYNSKEFRAIADFYSNQDLTNATAEQVKSAYEQALPAIEKYFTTGREGIDAFVTDMKQLSDAEGLGWVTELEDGSLSFNTGSDKEIADRLGIDVEAIQSIYRMMSEYVDGIVIGDTSGLNAFTAQVESAQQKLTEMQQSGEISSEISLDYDVNEMSLDEITAKIEELKGERVEIDAETNPEAAKALDDLIAKTEQAYYFKLNVDTNGGLDKASSAINGIQQRISELSTENPVLSVSAIVNGDEQIQTLAEELASLPPEVQTTVGITTENVSNVSGIISQLAQNPESISVPVNYTKGSEPETVDDAEGVANFTLGTSPTKVPDATGTANFRLGTYPTSLPTLTQFVRRVEINSEATGTMLSPAHAKGSVALPEDQIALVNEMGQESRIHNGIWELLPPGMHVQKLDKGDIILSARQTADLLKSGKAHGIGKAYADGTAFNGMPAHSSGGWTIGGSSNTGSSTSSSNNSNNNNSGNAIINTINRVTNTVTRNLETFQKWLEKLVDWVEVRIQRINDRIDLYTAQSENAIGYRNQNSLLARAQRWNDNLLRDQQRGRDRYLQQANQVTEEAIASRLVNGNSESQRRARANTLIDRIQNGRIDINEYNENEREFITAYTEWYNRAQQLNLAIEETIANQRDLEQRRFENIADEYDNIISRIEHRSNMINEQMSQNEAAGYVGSRAYYQLLAGDARERQQRLQEEQSALAQQLQDSMNRGDIQYGDERWYEMQNRLNQVSEELQSVNGELIGFDNNIRALEWEQFDRGQETISRLTDEFNFMIDLMSDEQLFDDMGQATNEGLATMGLHAGNYNVYMEQANEYAQEYQRIQQELAKDPYNTDLIERRNELLDLQQESIAAAEDEKQALRDLVQQGIDAELNSLQKLIDKYKNALKSKKDLYDYQRDIADKTSEVSNLQKQINAFSMDTSEEGRLRLQQAQDALREAQENLQQTEYERYISDQEELLDNLYTEYEDVLNARLDNIDELVSTVIASTNENAATISATLQEQAANVNYTMTDAMNRVWNSNTANGNIVSEFNDNFSQATNTIQTTIDGILGDITRMYEHSDWEAVANIANILDESRNGSNPQITSASTSGGSNGTTGGDTGGNTGGNGNGNGNREVANGPVSGIKATLKKGSKNKNVGELQKALNALGYKDQYGQKLKIDNWFGPRTEGALKKFQKAMKISATGKLDAATKKKFKAKGYAAGTDWVDKDEWAWTQEDGREIVVRPDGSILTPLQKGSSVINNPTTEKLFALANNADAIQDMVNISGSLMKSQQAAAASATEKQIMQQIVTNNNQNAPQNVSLECNINLPNVYEPKDFMNWLMDSRIAQRALQDYVLGEAFGKANITTRSHKF